MLRPTSAMLGASVRRGFRRMRRSCRVPWSVGQLVMILRGSTTKTPGSLHQLLTQQDCAKDVFIPDTHGSAQAVSWFLLPRGVHFYDCLRRRGCQFGRIEQSRPVLDLPELTSQPHLLEYPPHLFPHRSARFHRKPVSIPGNR
jgi:hypothetical protein